MLQSDPHWCFIFWSNRNAYGGCRDDFLDWWGEILRIVAIYRVLRVLVSDVTAFYACELCRGRPLSWTVRTCLIRPLSTKDLTTRLGVDDGQKATLNDGVKELVSHGHERQVPRSRPCDSVANPRRVKGSLRRADARP